MTTGTARDCPAWEATFIRALEESRGSVFHACKATIFNGRPLARSSLYKHRAECPMLAAAWDDTVELSIDALEAAAMRRAIDGWTVPVLHNGRIVTERDPSDSRKTRPVQHRQFSAALTIYMLKQNRPDKYSQAVGSGADPAVYAQHVADLMRAIAEGVDQGGVVAPSTVDQAALAEAGADDELGGEGSEGG